MISVMRLSRYAAGDDSRWALDDQALSPHITLAFLLSMRREEMDRVLARLPKTALVDLGMPDLLPPIEAKHEVWACGVTYLRSRIERESESTVADVYAKVYEADRPEIFFKATGPRVVGHGQPIRVRRDSAWNVPEPELTLVINRFGEIVGYTVGNDVSSRSIEGENPLYLPQAKTYDGSCALGPAIVLASEEELADLPIDLSIRRDEAVVFKGEARTSQMKRSFVELAAYLYRETSFPYGAFAMTGTGIVPTAEFTLTSGDQVDITVGNLTLSNPVA